jgi:hypothetical protein
MQQEPGVTLEEQWKAATRDFEAALAEYQSASSALIEHLRSRIPVHAAEWRSEHSARVRLRDASDRVNRLKKLPSG